MAVFGTGAIAVIVGLLAFGMTTANADVYSVYLYYDHGKLVFDHTYDKKVEVFQGMQVGTSYPKGDFKAEVIDQKGSVLHSATFDPRPRMYWDNPTGGGGSKLLDQGQTSLLLTYFPIATGLKIYDPEGSLILEYDISSLATCNLNGICNTLAGENSTTCPQDCKKVVPGEKFGETKTSRVSWFWWITVVVVIGILGFILWKLRRRKFTQQSPL